jgi:hypothetical protein
MTVVIILGTAGSFLKNCKFQNTALNKFEFLIYILINDPE